MEIETTIKTNSGVRITVSEWENGGAWFNLQVTNGSAYTVLSSDEIEQLIVGLQAILDKEVTV